MADIKYILTTEDESRYLKELLRMRLDFSGRLVKKIKYDGQLTLNGRPAKLHEKGRAGDTLCVSYPEEESYFEPENIPVEIVYEDDDMLVVNKPAGLIVHPTKNFQDGTLANALAWHIKERGDKYKLRFVNRLDMNTSGLLIVAKNSHCQDFLTHEMERNAIVKNYLAIVHGTVGEPGTKGTVDAPIDKDPNHVARRMVTPTGYPSVTHYEVLQTIAPSDADLQGFGPSEHSAGCNAANGPDTKQAPLPGYSLLKLRLDTGRTHQIRVHMTHIGHPLLGDELYGELYGYGELPPEMPRQALHASHLEFRHPMSGDLLSFDARLPEDMQSWLAER